jgi:hypothetical protein
LTSTSWIIFGAVVVIYLLYSIWIKLLHLEPIANDIYMIMPIPFISLAPLIYSIWAVTECAEHGFVNDNYFLLPTCLGWSAFFFLCGVGLYIHNWQAIILELKELRSKKE